MTEPIFQLPAERGSDAWQEGRQYVDKPASGLTDDDWRMLSAGERAEALAWLDKHPNDHEAALHSAEPATETVNECAASAAE